MRIGQAGRELGISERTLRYYEEQGLLRPSRTEGGQREYAENDLRTVRNIRTMLAAGLGTTVIAELLPCMRDEDGNLAPACAELVDQLALERDRIVGAIDELQSARVSLEAIIDAAPARTGAPVA